VKKACLVITGLLFFLIIASLVLALFQNNIPLGSKIALIRVEGPILDSGKTVDEIKKYANDASIKAIVIRVDSPGGAVAPSQEIYAQVKKAAAKKSVVVSMGSIAASGGYYISAPATKIIANPGTLTGSLGVILEIPNIEKLMEKIGVKTEVIKSGRHKDIGSMYRPIGKEEKNILQGVMDNVHEQFIKAVAEGRGLDIDAVKKIADGRIFTGEQAVEYGLVDELGTLEDSIEIAAEMAGITGEPNIVTRENKLSIFDILRNKLPREMTDIFPAVTIKYLYSP